MRFQQIENNNIQLIAISRYIVECEVFQARCPSSPNKLWLKLPTTSMSNHYSVWHKF